MTGNMKTYFQILSQSILANSEKKNNKKQYKEKERKKTKKNSFAVYLHWYLQKTLWCDTTKIIVIFILNTTYLHSSFIVISR